MSDGLDAALQVVINSECLAETKGIFHFLGDWKKAAVVMHPKNCMFVGEFVPCFML